MKVGVVGLGYWGKKVIKSYQLLEKRGVVDQVLGYDNRIIKDEAIDVCLSGSIQEIIRDSDAIHLCTPNITHFDLAHKVLKASKHILIEKPFALNKEDAFTLLRLASEHGVMLKVGHIFRFSNILKMSKHFVDSGEIGRVLFLELSWQHKWESDSTSKEDVIWDILPHPIDITNFYLSEWPTNLFARGFSYIRKDLNDAIFLNCSTNSGVGIAISVSGVSPRKCRSVSIIGESGQIAFDALGREITLFKPESEKQVVEVLPNDTILDEIIDFMSATKNRRNSNNSGIDGMRNVEILGVQR